MLKDLPKDLIAAVGEVVQESVKNRKEKYRKLVKQALEQFNVRSFSQLNETEQRIFSEWVTSRLDEEKDHVHTEECGCLESDLLHLKAKVDAHSGLPELGEEDEKELEEDEDEEKLDEEDDKEDSEDLKEDDIPGQDDSAFHKERNEEDELEFELGEEDEKEKVEESCCYASDEPSSAIGHRLDYEQPKHCDVLKDSDAINGTTAYRLLLQFVNGRPEIIPPLTLPGAPSVEALIDIVSDLPDDNGVISNALGEALDEPAKRPQYKGNDK